MEGAEHGTQVPASDYPRTFRIWLISIRTSPGVRLASLLKYLRILGTEESKIINVDGFLCEVVSQPAGERWWKLGIDHTTKGELVIATHAASVG